ncbi:5-carboxymethyl-2-hydroxymuconate isomerase [Arsukibacterium ikkense]|uniref:5-carboxymethyl-2-hydroxymuconate isomerase n=1 Tax=Arsukibacterium ikkense TaxID=336831 RepID=A0A0M2V8B2_9GAMM|nr:5-carboxymethyl-2-hydroxymuconate Delta-isomerase [Arsukibacterium ikkense]KKO46644.1 5-carboxymethyl-2-hydroxymuconate isomerase [Arsukibacterium ikkense]
MPHCIVEHSASLDAEPLLKVVFSGALNSALFAKDGADIKVRAITYQHYLSEASTSNFVHVVLKILSGRTLEQKQLLSKAVLDQLLTLDFKKCSMTVEIVDIDRASYAKFVG